MEFCYDDGAYNLFDALQGSPDSTGTWQPSLSGGFLGTFDASANQSGTYTYIVTDCDISDTAFVDVDVIDVNAGESLCRELGDRAFFSAGDVSSENSMQAEHFEGIRKHSPNP